MFARLTRYEGVATERIDDALAEKTKVLPTEPGQVEGMRGAVFCADRSSGTILAMSLWEDEKSLQESERMATQLREQVTGEGETATVETFEIARFSVTQP